MRDVRRHFYGPSDAATTKEVTCDSVALIKVAHPKLRICAGQLLLINDSLGTGVVVMQPRHAACEATTLKT